MKKILLYLSFTLLTFTLVEGQTKCLTCKEGMHDGINFSAAKSVLNSSPKTGDGNSALGQSYVQQNLCGMNYVQASVQTTTRYTATVGTGFPTTLNIAGLPVGFTVQKAYVYYGASYTEGTAPATSVDITNPAAANSTIASTIIGTAPSVCWGETGTASYRCDVTAMISGNGAYTVDLPGFANEGYEVDGATLIIIYVDPAATYSGNISLWDGDISNSTGAPINVTETGITACTSSIAATGFGIYGDMQSNVNGGTNTETFNGTSQTFNNNFWNFNAINSTANLTACQASITYNSYTNNTSDCFFITALGIYWQYSSCNACSSITYTQSQVNPTCGNSNGSATITVTGGTPPYTYVWNPSGQTTATATGLSAGTYTVTVNDAGCNVITATYTLVNTGGPTVTSTINANEKCNGGTSGSATITVAGGTSPYTYSWNPGGYTTATVSTLSAGTYTVTVTDNKGCVGTTTVTITQPAALNATTTSTSATCGNSNGTATVTVTGGTSPYTYLWTPSSETTATATGLSAGVYFITITDANGCNINATATVANSSGVTTSISNKTNVLCNGGNTGSATVSASGGTLPYTYLWSPSGQTTATATGLSAGNYTVTVTDNNGCSTPALVTITQPTLVRDSISSIIYPKCNGGLGSATIGIKGGTPAYTYSWSPGGQTTATVSTLSAGTYTITITDNNGCLSTVSVTITQPVPIVVTTTNTKTTCSSNNGTATASATGGTLPYTYLWTPGGQTTATATGLSVGTYTITVTDANGCSGTSTAIITAINPPVVKDSLQTNEKCNGGSSGSATVAVSGGTLPYTYLWNPGGQTTASVSGLSAGTYTVTVHDANGCITTTTVTITQPAPVTGTATSTGVLCNGGSTGTATVTASGGTAPYTYVWNPGGQTTATVSGLSAGTYTVTITDNNGCTGTASVTVTQPAPVTANVSNVTDPKCNGGQGSATVSASGGTAPFTYLWNPGGYTTATVSTLSAGTYTITVTDNNGCIQTTTVTITQPSAITTVMSQKSTTCGNDTGRASVVASGGTSPYTYLWVPGGQTTATITGLSAGIYTVIVADNNGCTATNTITVTTISSINLAVTSTSNVKCNGDANGSATITPSGGTAPYTYQWNPGGQTTATVTGLSAGTYTVLVTDKNGCNNTVAVVITQPQQLMAPISTLKDISCNGLTNGSATVTPSGGTKPYTYLWTPPGNTTASISGLSACTYTITVTDSNGCSLSSAVIISQPPAITTTLTSTAAACSSNNGTATVTVSGGTAPYTYYWSPSAETTATATGLSSGVYTVTVTDYNGCNQVDTITVHNTSTLSITMSGTDILCNGGNTGTSTVTASGGTSPYTYLWNPGGGTTATITGLSAGTYTAVVTDNAGCNQFSTITITQPNALSLTTSTTSSGCSNNTGSATVTVSGGTGVYTYSWNPGGGTTSTISGLGSGSYTITVTDANGCTSTAVANVGGSGVTGSITAFTNIQCFGSNSGTATVTASGGTTPYTYTWAPGGQTSATATGLSAGTYTVLVQDSNGCSFTSTVTISEPASALAETNAVTNASCNSTNNGSIALTVSGGTPQYTFNWSNGSTTQNLTNILPGSYTVTIKDSNGCTLIDSMKVGYDSSVFANAGKDTVICHNSTVILNGTGSVNATSYQWFQMPGMVLIKDTSVVIVNPSNDTTTYILVVENGTCFDTSSITVIMAPAISADAGPDQIIVGSGTVTLGGSPTGPGGSNFFWNPGVTLNDSLISNPAATPTVTTIYTVVVKNSAGCTATDTVTIFVEAGVVVPNGFSPNADGTNDTWVLPFAGEFPNIVVEVYNRWGELLFTSTGNYTPWNGEYNGKPLPVGTYYYIVKLNDPRFPNALTGPLTIMR